MSLHDVKRAHDTTTTTNDGYTDDTRAKEPKAFFLNTLNLRP